MSEAVFSQLAMLVFLTGLIVWMGFIVWDLAKKSQAGLAPSFYSPYSVPAWWGSSSRP